MKIYTSYFASKAWDHNTFTAVNIARSIPKGMYVPLNIDIAKPSAQLLYDYKHGACTWEQYEVRYTAEVQDKLQTIRDMILTYWSIFNKPVVLLCWEGKGKNCHRHLLAKLLRERFNMEVEEL